MGRGRNPERTRQKILEVAEQLFLEKGYDDTSIQDIIDGLGGLTKGVIYHHFKSKQDIFETIMSKTGSGDIIEQWQGNTGMEKLQNSLRTSFQDHRRQAVGYSAIVMLRSPRMLGEHYHQIFDEIAPAIKLIVEEGIQDGSIQTEFPEEVAELLMITMNLWLGFQSTVLSNEAMKRKCLFIKQLFEGVGVPLITDELLNEMYNLVDTIKK